MRTRALILVGGVALIVGTTPFARATLTVNSNILAKSTVDVSGSISKGAGTFVIDDPIDPENKLLYHSFVESPDAMNVYEGIALLDASGTAAIALPAYFEALNTDVTYQFFPLDRAMPDLYLEETVHDNHFTIAGGVPGGAVSWMVTGVRHDPYIRAHPIIPEVEKGPHALLPKGECIYPPLCK